MHPCKQTLSSGVCPEVLVGRKHKRGVGQHLGGRLLLLLLLLLLRM